MPTRKPQSPHPTGKLLREAGEVGDLLGLVERLWEQQAATAYLDRDELRRRSPPDGLTIRNLDAATEAQLRLQAARHGRLMEEEARRILRQGVDLELPEGRRRQALRESWDALLPALFGERVWPFEREAAQRYGELLRRRERLGDPLATCNVADFAGIGMDLINPWPPA